MIFDMPARHHFKIEAKCPTHSRTDVTAYHHKVVVDEPEIRGDTARDHAIVLSRLSQRHLASNCR